MNVDMIKGIFTWLGGIGTIFFIPKLYLEYRKQKKLQEKQMLNNKKLQREQHQLNKEITELKAKQDSILFMTNRQYEKEFDIYLEIFDSIGLSQRILLEIFESFELLNEDVTKSNDLMEEMDRNLKNEVHNLNYINKKYAPFMQKNINTSLSKLVKEFQEISSQITTEYSTISLVKVIIPEEKTTDEISSYIKKINKIVVNLEKDIRNYLNKIRITN